jgi:hypothetical protein
MRANLRHMALLSILLLSTAAAWAHHSFAIFDFQTKVPFEGVVDSIKFRNPHIEMTLKVVAEDGSEKIVHFIEGAPANMLVRGGITPDKMKPGSKLWTEGSPLLEDPNKFFLRTIRTEDGTEYGN